MTKRRMSIGLFLSFLAVATAAIWLTVPAGNAAPAGADVSIGSISCAPGSGKVYSVNLEVNVGWGERAGDRGGGQGTLVVSRACNAEMPNTRVCDWSELFSTIPPPQLAGPVILPTTLGGSSTASCITADGLERCLSTDEPASAACCSY